MVNEMDHSHIAHHDRLYGQDVTGRFDFHRQEREDEPMHAHGHQRGPTRSGQAVVLVGVATFLVGSFLPFYELGTNETVSLARQMISSWPSGGAGWVPGGILLLFAATAVVVVTAGIGLGERARGTAAPALVGAAATWSLIWAGWLLRSSSSGSFAVGYFVAWVGVVVVIVGTLIVFASMRLRTSPGAVAQR